VAAWLGIKDIGLATAGNLPVCYNTQSRQSIAFTTDELASPISLTNNRKAAFELFAMAIAIFF
jgi:hypothetical protein